MSIVFVFGAITLIPAFSTAQEALATSNAVISEVQTASSQSSSQEFVELYNPQDNPLDLSGWSIEYKSSTGTSWSNKAGLTGIVQPRGFWLVSTEGYLATANGTMSSGLAGNGGHVRIVNALGSVVDLVGWGTADSPETLAINPVAASGESMSRKFDSSGYIIDTNNNQQDFLVSAAPTPNSTPPPAGDEPDEPEPEPTPTPPAEYLDLEITELLPDPAAPQTDSNDEFVELYNPNAEAVELGGYQIKTGSQLQNNFVIPAGTILPGQYVAFYSSQGVSLTNSGGSAQLFDPDGQAASELISYEAAKAGMAWAASDSVWQWTASPTPGAANIFSEEKEASKNAKTYPPILINELFVDPSAPQQDDEDEFIELYNPNPVPVDLEGVQILSGSSQRTKFTLPAGEILPGEYKAYYSKDANISLSNTAGAVKLATPGGQTISESQAYEEADAGDSWARFDTTWQWTGSPTPGAPNVLTTSSKATKTSKAKAAKSSSKAKAAKSSKAKSSKNDSVTSPATIPTSPLSSGIVATAAGLALLYGAYEFRYDIRNQFEVIRRFFSRS